jgi:hypothetical protein
MVNGKILFFVVMIQGALPAIVAAYLRSGFGALPGSWESNVTIVSKHDPEYAF